MKTFALIFLILSPLFAMGESMKSDIKILIVYHSETGKTAKMAQDMSKAISNYPNTKVITKSIKEVSPESLGDYDGIAFGSPVYFGAISGEMKTFLDKTLSLWKAKKLSGKPASIFLSFESGSGKETALHNFWSILSSHQMILMPYTGDLEQQGTLLAEVATKLKKEVVQLPEVPAPVGNYSPYKISGKYVYINQIALKDGKVLHPGTIGENLSEAEAMKAVQQTTLNVMAVLKQAVNGDLSKVKQAVQITGYFKTTSDFQNHSQLLNEASNLIVQVLGKKGVHARASLGAPSLPMNSSNEIHAIFELR